MPVKRLRALLDRLERTKPSSRLLLAWAVCALPRAALALLVGLDEDYSHFVHGRTNSAWYPFYESLATLLWGLSGSRMVPYFAAHLVLHAMIGPCVYALAKKLLLGGRAAWLAVLGVALMPYYVSLSARQPQVGVAVVMLAALVLAFATWAEDFRSLRAGLIFATAAALTLTLRPNAVSTIAGLYLLALAWGAGSRPGGWRAEAYPRILLSGALFAVLLAGLAATNLQREGRFSPFTGNLGFNLYVGNNPRVGEFAGRYDITSLQDVLADGLPPEAAATAIEKRDPVYRRLALGYMAAHPWRTLWNAVLKSWRYWDPRLEDSRLTPLHWNLAYTVPYVVYGLLALAGAWICWKRGPRAALLVCGVVLVSYWLPHAVFFGTIRMRMTTEFLLIVLAAVAAADWIDDD